MSYNGTVRCSHCYQTGHNKRSCPALNERYLNRYKQSIADVEYYESASDKELKTRGEHHDRQWNIDYHTRKAEEYRAIYIKRTKIDPATGKKVTNKAAKAERMKSVTCGYCGVKGHTRRTCQNAKNDYALYMEQTRRVRTEWYEKFKASGMGIGSLVVAKTHGYNHKNEWGLHNVAALVTRVDFDSIDAHSHSIAVLELSTNSQLKGQSSYGGALRNLNLDAMDHANIIERRPSGSVPPMPNGWLENFAPMKQVFSTKEQRAYTYAWQTDSWTDNIRQQLNIPKCAYTS